MFIRLRSTLRSTPRSSRRMRRYCSEIQPALEPFLCCFAPVRFASGKRWPTLCAAGLRTRRRKLTGPAGSAQQSVGVAERRGLRCRCLALHLPAAAKGRDDRPEQEHQQPTMQGAPQARGGCRHCRDHDRHWQQQLAASAAWRSCLHKAVVHGSAGARRRGRHVASLRRRRPARRRGIRRPSRLGFRLTWRCAFPCSRQNVVR